MLPTQYLQHGDTSENENNFFKCVEKYRAILAYICLKLFERSVNNQFCIEKWNILSADWHKEDSLGYIVVQRI